MTLSYEGSLSVGQCVPAALEASAQLTAACNTSLPDIQARVAGLLQLSIAPPASLADLIASVTALLASLQALLAAPLPDVTATAAALAELQVSLGALTASLSFSLNLASLLGTPGISYYLYAGRADALGAEASAALSGGLPGGAGGAENIAGAILLANDGGAIAALQAVLRS